MNENERRPDFTGVWELNLAKSVMRWRLPQRMLVTIEHREPELVQRIAFIDAEGRETQMTLTFHCAGVRVHPVGTAELRTEGRWEGRELLLESWMEAAGRKVHYKDYWSVSEDGKTLTMEHRDDDMAGQISVLEKIG